VTSDCTGDLDTASLHQDEIALHFLVLCIGGLEMLVPVAQRPPARL
jgi:hypothetical protein